MKNSIANVVGRRPRSIFEQEERRRTWAVLLAGLACLGCLTLAAIPSSPLTPWMRSALVTFGVSELALLLLSGWRRKDSTSRALPQVASGRSWGPRLVLGIVFATAIGIGAVTYAELSEHASLDEMRRLRTLIYDDIVPGCANDQGVPVILPPIRFHANSAGYVSVSEHIPFSVATLPDGGLADFRVPAHDIECIVERLKGLSVPEPLWGRDLLIVGMWMNGRPDVAVLGDSPPRGTGWVQTEAEDFGKVWVQFGAGSPRTRTVPVGGERFQPGDEAPSPAPKTVCEVLERSDGGGAIAHCEPSRE